MNYIVFDLESTCWKGKPPGMIQEVIEIGAYKIHQTGRAIDKFQRLIKPQAHPVLSLFCKRLTGITQPEINKARGFEYVIEEFKEWIDIDEEYTLCAWGPFDREILVANCRMFRLDTDWLDPYLNIKKKYNRLRKFSRPAGLNKALRYEGFDFDGDRHRALDDAFNTAKIFIKYLDELIA